MTKMPAKSKSKATGTRYARAEHNISRRNIDKDALQVMHFLNAAGFRGYLVGGGVRDLLLQKRPKDFDIATDATPEQVRGLFRRSRIIGKRFKLVHVYFRNYKYIEVATFRAKDSEAKSENLFGDESTDANRRDITINGLFYDLASTSILDYVGGMEDLKNKTVRIIGNPKERYDEDPIRMIRAIRHAARAEFSIEKKTWKALLGQHKLLGTVSAVRLFEEVKKDLCCGFALPTFELLAEADLLQCMLPSLVKKKALNPETHVAELLREGDALAQKADLDTPTVMLTLLSLATALPDYDKEILTSPFEDERVLKEHVAACFPKLQVPRKERERIETLLRTWHRIIRSEKKEAGKVRVPKAVSFQDLRFLLQCTHPHTRHANLLKELVQTQAATPSPRRGRKRRPHKNRRRRKPHA